MSEVARIACCMTMDLFFTNPPPYGDYSYCSYASIHGFLPDNVLGSILWSQFVHSGRDSKGWSQLINDDSSPSRLGVFAMMKMPRYRPETEFGISYVVHQLIILEARTTLMLERAYERQVPHETSYLIFPALETTRT